MLVVIKQLYLALFANYVKNLSPRIDGTLKLNRGTRAQCGLYSPFLPCFAPHPRTQGTVPQLSSTFIMTSSGKCSDTCVDGNSETARKFSRKHCGVKKMAFRSGNLEGSLNPGHCTTSLRLKRTMTKMF